MTKKKKNNKPPVTNKTAKKKEKKGGNINLPKKEVIEEKEINEVDKLAADLAESKDKYLRLYSEFDNYRRRTAKEKLELMLTAGEKIISDLIPVLDDFERALKSSTPEEKAPVFEGIALISQKFEHILQNQGLKAMETSKGTNFDPEIHEAITQIPAPSKKLKGKIVDTIEKGYYLSEKVIRFAKVVTGS